MALRSQTPALLKLDRALQSCLWRANSSRMRPWHLHKQRLGCSPVRSGSVQAVPSASLQVVHNSIKRDGLTLTDTASCAHTLLIIIVHEMSAKFIVGLLFKVYHLHCRSPVSCKAPQRGR